MTPHRCRWTLVFVIGLVTACGDHEFDRPDDSARQARADSAFSAALFDTLAWASQDQRLRQGNLVFADECRRCHGPLGRGETDYASENDLDVPSLVDADWRFAGRPDSLRRQIFVGHGREMPGWGVGRLTPRQIDAATAYILEQLRPEVLGGAELPGSD